MFFPGGYNNAFSFLGGTWTKPPLGSRALDFLSSVGGLGKLSVEASGGEITSSFEENLTFGTDNRFVFVYGVRKPSLVLIQSTGVLTGSITKPANRKPSLRGVLYRNFFLTSKVGVGLLSGTTRTQAFSVTTR